MCVFGVFSLFSPMPQAAWKLNCMWCNYSTTDAGQSGLSESVNLWDT